MSVKIPKHYNELIYQRYTELLSQGVRIMKIAQIINSEIDKSFAESSLRCRYQKMKEIYETKVDDTIIDKVKHQNEVLEKRNSTAIKLMEDGTTVSERKLILSETQLKSKELLLQAHGFDTKEFELVNATNNFWDSQTSEGKVLTLYQSKITVRPISERKELTLDDIKIYLDLLKNEKFVRDFKIIKVDTSQETYALEIDWADLHVGSLSWHEEVGEDNDYKIAFGNVRNVMGQIIEIILTRRVHKVIHCFLGDFLHIDTGGLTTSGGTQVDFDSRPLKMIKKGYELVSYIIDNTPAVEVEVKWVPGNHSKLIEFAVFYAMPMIYKKETRIKFDVSPKGRKVLVYGKNLIGLAHGNDVGKKEQDTWLQYDFREEWSNAEYAEIHMGHLHKEVVTDENGGITKRTNPAFKIIDKYEYDHAWISKKVVLCYLWHETKNLREIFYIK